MLADLKNSIGTMLAEIERGSEAWISRFILTTLDGSGTPATAVFSDAGAFQAAIEALDGHGRSPACSLPIGAALLASLQKSLDSSLVFAFVAGTASDYADPARIYDEALAKRASVRQSESEETHELG